MERVNENSVRITYSTHLQYKMRKLFRYLLIIISITLLLATLTLIGLNIYGNIMLENAGRTEEWTDKDGVYFENLSYGPHALNTYDLYLPNKQSSNPDSIGCLLYIHGGSWSSGSKEEGAWFCRRYAKAGFVTASMNYSLVSPKSPATCIPTMIKEISHCIEQLTNDAAQNGYNVNKIALAGYSAGAHLAMLYGLKHKEQSPVPLTFLVSMSGPTDFTQLFNLPIDTINNIRHQLANGINHPFKKHIDAAVFISTGKQLSKSDDYSKHTIDSLLLSASPIQWITTSSLPIIIAHGMKDPLVVPMHSLKLDSIYTATGVPHTFITYPHSNHFLADDTASVKQLHQEIINYSNQYLK